jgi:hypothetical protein
MDSPDSRRSVQGEGDTYLQSIRLIVFIPCLVVTGLALLGYATNIAGHEVYLFVAGLTGGAALAEMAGALERRDDERENRKLAQQNASLMDQLVGISEPPLAAAVEVGSNFAQRQRSPDTTSARYLGINEEIRSSKDSNDVHAICDVLRTRFGDAASESFLLGRQLTLLLVSEQVSEETRGMVRDRLGRRVADDELAGAVDKVLAERRPGDDAATSKYMRYLSQLLIYLSRSTGTKEARESREQLILGLQGVASKPADDGAGSDSFIEFLKGLVDAGIHKTDPDVLFFWGAVNGDAAIMDKALKGGANSSLKDWEIERRYRNFPHDAAQGTSRRLVRPRRARSRKAP